MIPTNDGLSCVFASLPPDEFRRAGRKGLESAYFATVRRMDPELAHTLARGRPHGTLRGFAGVQGFLKRSVGPGWALVGDAGYFKDPLTAHGMTDALRDAELLARSIATGREVSLREYQEARDAVSHELMDVTDRIASLEWSTHEVRQLHERLAEAMKAGIDVVRRLDSEETSRGGFLPRSVASGVR